MPMGWRLAEFGPCALGDLLPVQTEIKARVAASKRLTFTS